MLDKFSRRDVNTLKKYKYYLKDLDCANCAAKIQDAVAKQQGFEKVNVNFAACKLSLETENTNPQKVVKEIVAKVEPEVTVQKWEETEVEEEEKGIVFPILRLVFGILFGILAMWLPVHERIQNVVWILGYSILLYRTAITAAKKLFRAKQIDESLLITISCIGAFCVGERLEGLMVIFLYEIGEMLEDRAVDRSRKSIQKLMDIKPEYANRKTAEGFEKVSPEEIKVGDTILVKQGEKIPLDGVISLGNSQLDTSALTGESKLREVKEQDEVLSGSINLGAVVEMQVTKEYQNSTVYKILELVENATDKKAKTETFVSKAAKIYTPIVILLAVIVAVCLPMIAKDVTYSQSIYRALAFLVISCPCAIAISVPLGYFSGIGRASKSGILVKGSQYLDNLNHIREIVLDKTGTITTGEFHVAEIKSLSPAYTNEQILAYMAKGESFSNHPIALSIMKEVNHEIDTSDVENYHEIAGKGMEYEIQGTKVKIGNASLVGVTETEELTGTSIYLKIGEEVVGQVLLKDTIKKEAKQTMKDLHKMGVTTHMFTGDKKEVAQAVAKEIGIQEVKYEMLPQDKYAVLEEHLNKRKDEKGKVAFVGDGINDSPVLARADIGISMGGVGSQSAIEASDVVIMTDDLAKIPEAIHISNRTIHIIRQNLIFAIATKIVVLVLSALGMAQMWHAVFADVGVTLLTILNTLRILKTK